jgi:hypothetical protein
MDATLLEIQGWGSSEKLENQKPNESQRKPTRVMTCDIE